jgi:hypothetical protein
MLHTGACVRVGKYFYTSCSCGWRDEQSATRQEGIEKYDYHYLEVTGYERKSPSENPVDLYGDSQL